MKLKCVKKDEGSRIKNFVTTILHDEFSIDMAAYPHSDLDDLENSYGGQREVFYCLIDNKKIVGTVAVKNDDEKTALLRRLFVDPKYRGQGLGKKLVDAALKFCKENKYERICFRCTERMQNAMKLCKAYGFVETEQAELAGFTIHHLLKEIP